MSEHPIGIGIPPVSEDVFRKLEEAFPQLEITPNGTSIDEVMFNAGERKVLEWLQQFRRGFTITGGR